MVLQPACADSPPSAKVRRMRVPATRSNGAPSCVTPLDRNWRASSPTGGALGAGDGVGGGEGVGEAPGACEQATRTTVREVRPSRPKAFMAPRRHPRADRSRAVWTGRLARSADPYGTQPVRV